MGRRLNQRDFPERRKTPWRTIFVGIILLTIPLYIIGLGLWLFAPSPNAPTPTPTNEPFATFTPLGQGGATPNVTAPSLDSDLGNTFLTLVATEVNVTGAPVLTVVVTNPPIIQPTDAFQPVTIVPPSQVPTFFITNTPIPQPSATPMPVATNTPSAPVATNVQPPTQPILVPPTDTPSP